MSIRLLTLAWKTKCESSLAKVVLVAMADYADDDGICWPSVSGLSEKCSCSRQSVITALAMLKGRSREKISHGKLNGEYHVPLIEVVDSKKGGRSKYRVLLVKPVDQSSGFTSQAALPPPVKPVDRHRSSRLTEPVKRLDPNRKEPSVQPPVPLQGPRPDFSVAMTFKADVSKMMNRPLDDPWSNEEEFELTQVLKRPKYVAEAKIIAGYLTPGKNKWPPQSLGALLRDWTGTLDKARNYREPSVF